MDHFKHPACNGALHAPEGQEESVSTLHVCRGFAEEYGCNVVQSFWKPNAEELALLMAGGCVLLSVFGKTHAPLSVGVAEWRDVPDKDVALSAVTALVAGLDAAGFAVRVDQVSEQPWAMSRWKHVVDVQPKFTRLVAA